MLGSLGLTRFDPFSGEAEEDVTLLVDPFATGEPEPFESNIPEDPVVESAPPSFMQPVEVVDLASPEVAPDPVAPAAEADPPTRAGPSGSFVATPESDRLRARDAARGPCEAAFRRAREAQLLVNGKSPRGTVGVSLAH